MTKLTEVELEAIRKRSQFINFGFYAWDDRKREGKRALDLAVEDFAALFSHIEAQAAEIAETRETTIKECFDYLLSAATNNYGKDQKKRDVENEVVNAFAKQMLNDLASEDMRVEWKSQEDHQTEIAEKDARIKELEGALKWYCEEAGACHSHGERGHWARQALEDDQGQRAAKALRDGGEGG